MAFLEHKRCSSCGEMKQIASSVRRHNSICGDCYTQQEQKKKEEALAVLRDRKTLEERVAALEERMYYMDKEVRSNSSFRNMHSPIG